MDFLSLSPKYVPYLRIKALIFSVILLLPVIAAVIWIDPIPLWVKITAAALIIAELLFQLFWLSPRRYQLTGYIANLEQVQLKSGAIWRTVRAVAVNRIQHAETSQGPLERSMGLARLQVYTAGGMGADIVVPALPETVATELKERLLATVTNEDEAEHDLTN